MIDFGVCIDNDEDIDIFKALLKRICPTVYVLGSYQVPSSPALESPIHFKEELWTHS